LHLLQSFKVGPALCLDPRVGSVSAALLENDPESLVPWARWGTIIVTVWLHRSGLLSDILCDWVHGGLGEPRPFDLYCD
jgi:hypothetical protein